MGSRSKDGNAGDDGEGSEGDEAEPVQHLQDCDQLGLWLFPVNVFGIIVTDPSHSLDNPDPYDVDFKPDRENISPWRQTSNRSRWRRRRRRPSVWTWSPDQTTMTERTVYLQIDVHCTDRKRFCVHPDFPQDQSELSLGSWAWKVFLLLRRMERDPGKKAGQDLKGF